MPFLPPDDYNGVDVFHDPVQIPNDACEVKADLWRVPYSQQQDNIINLRKSLQSHATTEGAGTGGVHAAVPAFLTDVGGMTIAVAAKAGDKLIVRAKINLDSGGVGSEVLFRFRYSSSSSPLAVLPCSESVSSISNKMCLCMQAVVGALFSETYTFRVNATLNVGVPVDIIDTWNMTAEARRGAY